MGKGTSVALQINEDATNIESGRRAWIFYRTSKPAAEEEIDKKLKAIQENYERKGFSIVGATIVQGDDIGIKFAISCAFAVQSQTPFDYIICPSLSYLSRNKTKLASLLNFIKENDKKLIYEEKGLIARIDPEDKEFLAKTFLPEILDAEPSPPEQGMSL